MSALPGPVCVVGPGNRIPGGVTHYTYGLIERLDARHGACAVLLRRLAPEHLAEAHLRISGATAGLCLPPTVPVIDDVDWFTVSRWKRVHRHLEMQRPRALVLVWWTGATAHTYAKLATEATRLGIPVIIDFHGRGAGSDALLSRTWVAGFGRHLWDHAALVLTHSAYERGLVVGRFGVRPDRVLVTSAPRVATALAAPYRVLAVVHDERDAATAVRAFDALSSDVIDAFRLTLAGPQATTTAAAGLSRHGARVDTCRLPHTGGALDDLVGRAAIVVLPGSGDVPGGLVGRATALGLPVVASRGTPGSTVADGYGGTLAVRRHHVADLAVAMERGADLVRSGLAPTTAWEAVLGAYDGILRHLGVAGALGADAPHRTPDPAPADVTGSDLATVA